MEEIIQGSFVWENGIFSSGFTHLNGYFKRIFTTDSFKGQRGSNVTEIKLNDGLLS